MLSKDKSLPAALKVDDFATSTLSAAANPGSIVLMAAERARMVASSGEVFSAPFEYLTNRSVFLQGRSGLRFDEAVQLELLGVGLDARVAFVSYEPPGVVLTFVAPAAAEAVFRRWQQHRRETWIEEDLTNTVEGEEAEIVANLMARAATVTMEPREFDSEDPTNTGTRAVDVEEETSPAVVEVPKAYPGERRASRVEPPEGGARLRATTHVTEPSPPDQE